LPFKNIGDIDLYYEDCGEGVPLLFITGLSGSTRSYCGQIPFFKQYYRCIVFDNRGAGQSDKPEGPYTIARMAEDALALLDRLHIEKTLVFAMSMGGMIALELAKIASMRLGAMLLGCTNAGRKSRIPPSAEAMALLTDVAGISREEILWKQTPLFFSDKFRSENSKAIEEYYRMQLMTPLQPDYAYQAQVEAINRFDCTDALTEIRNPALAATGTEDVLIPPANSTYLAEHLPNSELIVIPGAGHALHVECRDFFNQAAHSFYQKHLGKVRN
jgi:pimeloyl-ACP methyl ester carboxylesterase